MTHNIEDLVRDAQERRADQAVSPDRILAALPSRAQRLRRRRTGTIGALVAATIAVVAAVTVPTLILRPAGGQSLDAGAQPATAPASPAPPGPGGAGPGGAPAESVPPGKLPPQTVTEPVIASTTPPELASMMLRYKLTWLPAGLAERSRAGWPSDKVDSADGPVVDRTWTARPIGESGEVKGDRLSLGFRWSTGPKDPQRYDGTPVTVNGKPGYYHDAGEKSYLEWRVDAERIASVSQHGLGLTKTDMIKVARSVRPDPGQLRSPLQFNRLPEDTQASYLEITGNSAESWRARAMVDTLTPGGGSTVLTVGYGTITGDIDSGEEVTVGGKPAHFQTRDLSGGGHMYTLVVELSATRMLTLISEYLDRDQMVTVAEGTRTSEPDVSWLGGRR